MTDAYIVGAVRSAGGRKNGRLSKIHPIDLGAEVVSMAVDGATVWTEWKLDGTRPDGVRSGLRGVILFGVADRLVHWARFYLEPLDLARSGVAPAVRRVSGARP